MEPMQLPADIGVDIAPSPSGSARASRYIERLRLTEFRGYAALSLDLGPEPVVLTGANGAGKTNLLEAVSLLAPGQGLRRAPYPELNRLGGNGGWAISARLATPDGPIEIGTGLDTRPGADRSGRIVRIDRQTVSGSGALADHVEMVWILPAMDGLFTGPAGERRRFLDRLILCFDPSYRTRVAHFERAMRQRNRLLETGSGQRLQLDGLERQMAETGVAIAAARAEAVDSLRAAIEVHRRAEPHSLFPWAGIELSGSLETALAAAPAVAVEEAYQRTLAAGRERDRAAGRTIEGPHRSDLVVRHGPKDMPAKSCSTGEQKALLVGLVLAHARLLAHGRSGAAPILLLDEIAAHLDEARRAALFVEVLSLGAQAWMTGTDRAAFAALEGRARVLTVIDGQAREL
jgi:DNA replication and repair protein RecF